VLFNEYSIINRRTIAVNGMAQILLLHLPHIKADTVRRTSGLAVSGVRLLAQRESPTWHQESTAALGAEVSTQF